LWSPTTDRAFHAGVFILARDRLPPDGNVAACAITLVNRRTDWLGQRRKTAKSPAIRRVDALGQSACILRYE
jgi:hypothetical protein